MVVNSDMLEQVRQRQVARESLSETTDDIYGFVDDYNEDSDDDLIQMEALPDGNSQLYGY